LKRALKKRVKAVLKNTPSIDGVPVEQANEVNSQINHRVRKAAMIGLAISMGATSLLVTQQSDQAQAAAPAGSEKVASTNSAAPDTEVKFATTKLESLNVSSASVPENPVIVEPTAISQVPGLEAKLQGTASGKSVQFPASSADPATTAPYKTSLAQQPQVAQGMQPIQNLSSGNGVVGSQKLLTTQPQTVITESKVAIGEVNAQLKAQQEFALNRLQEKSNRLRQSLTQLRSGESQNLSQPTISLAQPANVVDKAAQDSVNNSATEQSPTSTETSQTSLVSRLKQSRATGASVATPTLASPKFVAPSASAAYEVKPGDTLAAIASNYGTSVSELAKANNLSNPNELQISQKLTIPAAGVEQNTASVPTVAINPSVVQPGATPKVATSPVNQASVPVSSQLSIIANNSNVTVPTPVSTISPQTVPNLGNSYGMGGDTPVPKVFAEIQLAQKQESVAGTKSNKRLQSLQTEIERLRQKYRAQQSGVVLPPDSETNNPAVEIPVANSSNFAVSSPSYQRNAVQIPVPAPIGMTNYSTQPVRPLYRATRPSNEPVNPEFLPNQASGQWTPSGNTSDSLGKMRGTNVSPALPPLAAVDQYLPRTIDENTPPPSTSSVAYIWPAKGVFTSGFGMRWGRPHRGIDVANSTGTPIYASADGVVQKAGWNNGGYGNLVEIRHADGSMTRYGHNSRILVQVGQQVRQGETVALMGSTGFSTGPHTHFEIHAAGKGAVNPIAFLPNRV